MSLTAPYHPGGKGRVLALDAPYVLPEGMDLRGIAGIVLKRKQNPETAAAIAAMDEASRKQAQSQIGFYNGKTISDPPAQGPHRPSYHPPEFLKSEIEDLAAVFRRLAGVKETKVWFPQAPAQTFHVDGVETRPQWRLTYAFTGAQTVWHSYRIDEHTPRRETMGAIYPVMPDDKIGTENQDYFMAEGALMFLWNSPNSLFHKTPDHQDENRFLVTLDASSPQRADCNRSCPFPCR
jgi:hypothetical protein